MLKSWRKVNAPDERRFGRPICGGDTRDARPGRGARQNQTTYIFFAGAFPASAGLRSNFPAPSEKNTHSDALSQAVVWR
jgi:hypothetical protein